MSSTGRGASIRRRTAWVLATGLVVAAGLATTGSAAVAAPSRPGQVLAAVPVAEGPYELIVDGRTVWALSGGDQDSTLTRVDLRTLRVVATLRFPTPVSSSHGVMAVAGGDLWLTDEYANTLLRVDRRTSRLVQRLPVGTTPRGLLSHRGSLWVAAQNSRELVQVDARAGRVVARHPVGDPSVYSGGPSYVFTARGGLWVTVPALRAVQQVDPRTGRVVRTLRVTPGFACARPYAAGDRLWLVDRDCSESFTGIDLDDGRVVGHVDLSASDGLLFGGAIARGSLWTTEAVREGFRVVRRSLADGSAVAEHPVDGNVFALVPHHGDFWTTDLLGASVRRLRLR